MNFSTLSFSIPSLDIAFAVSSESKISLNLSKSSVSKIAKTDLLSADPY